MKEFEIINDPIKCERERAGQREKRHTTTFRFSMWKNTI